MFLTLLPTHAGRCIDSDLTVKMYCLDLKVITLLIIASRCLAAPTGNATTCGTDLEERGYGNYRKSIVPRRLGELDH